MPVMHSLQKFVKNSDGSYTIVQKNAPYGKISGTMMSGLLGNNPWNTPFSTAVKMMRMFNEDKSGNQAIRAGVVIEPKILDYLGATHGDDIFQKREGDHEVWPSDFDDEFFSGHIDGLMPDGAIVEIKTTSRPQDWTKGIPVYYHIQASLYAHFLNTDRIVFGVGFLDRNASADPDSWSPTKDNTAIIETTVMDGFDEMMEKAKAIYKDTVLNDTTPVPNMDSEIDREIVRYLDAQLWNDEQLMSQLELVKSLNDRLTEYKGIEDRLEEAKNELSVYMDYNEVPELENDSLSVTRNVISRTSIDTNLLKKDGLYDVYAKKKEYKSLKISNKRK